MSDVFRKAYRPLSVDEKARLERIKDQAQVLYDEIGGPSMSPPQDPRAIAVAKTKLEEAVMWAVKGISG